MVESYKIGKLRSFPCERGVVQMNYTFNDGRSEIVRFCDGDSVRAFDYFGAHPGERDGVPGVMFRVWAPNARNVAVAGDFNNWDKNAHFMEKREGGAWELFIPKAAPGQSYQYSVETPASERVTKSDPFAFFHDHPAKCFHDILPKHEHYTRDL